ncbi:nuclease A inhibitor family protein [Spirosoma sp. KNUC1025]|uniref:nuclease A inhibitor family protein n=1 Tax=Spirosoma sp. KNUC1025 TaxID=2894082 RepID=UPI0038643018|nr:nuclease A inhibitor family protein [Spirosoma sp. KNUC1025]
MTNDEPKSSGPVEENKSFCDQVSPLLTDLLYPSESDESIEPVTCYLNQRELLTTSQIKDWQMLPPSVYVEEIPEADFWEPVVTDQDWYEAEEKARTEKFKALQQLVETQLAGRQVFRVGETEIDIYLLGQQTNGERAGLKTKVVQT